MNSSDPRSFYYQRIYNKEPINIKRLAIIISTDLVITIILYYFLKKMIFIIVFNLIYILICLKYILILAIKLYQRFAPISIRSKCRFEPSCSNYAIQCLEKYGLFVGIKKSIYRIKRCNISDGGYDYP